MAVVALRPHTLYRFFDSDRVLLYVGITNDPSRRWSQHSNKPWWTEVALVTLEQFSTRDAVLVAEKDAIRDEQPRYNVVHNIGRRSSEMASVYEDPAAMGSLFGEQGAANRLEAVEAKLYRNSLVGSYFHGDPDRSWQGCVVAEPRPGVYLVELFSWLTGAPTQQQLVAIDDMAGWSFYDDSEWMTNSTSTVEARWERMRAHQPEVLEVNN